MITFQFRQATSKDFERIFELKSNALRPYIEQIWGWDEAVQCAYHARHFQPERIQIIVFEGEDIDYLELERIS